jgi:hypothetical protein
MICKIKTGVACEGEGEKALVVAACHGGGRFLSLIRIWPDGLIVP